MSNFRKEQRTLPCKLLPLEVAAKDSEARRQLILSAKAENERLDLVSKATEARKQVKGAQASALELAQVAEAGVEKRSVTCEWRPHPSRPVMQLHRLDVAEDDAARIVDERQMTKAEERGDFKVTAGDLPSSTEAASDTVAGNDKPAKGRGKATKGPIPCPGTVAEPDRDDPTKDTVCEDPCVPMKWACEKHMALPQGEKVRLVTRQKARNEALAKQAGELAQAEAAGQA